MRTTILTAPEDYTEATSYDLIGLKCPVCDKSFDRIKQEVQRSLKLDRDIFCSRRCVSHRNPRPRYTVPCKGCGKDVVKTPFQINKLKRKLPDNHFCGRVCAANYNKVHLNHGKGPNRSKLEVWLEGELGRLYPTLEILYNRRDIIGAELDIYVPSFKLAFELNGPFHYEPIFGQEVLESMQRRDANRFAKCHEMGISLCVIDVSHIKYHKPRTAQPILDIIMKILDEKVGGKLLPAGGASSST